MKSIKNIFFILLMALVSVSFAQNKKNHGTPPSPQNLPPEDHFSWINSCYGDTTCFINQSIRSYTYTWTILGDSVNFLGIHHPKTLYTNTNDSIICYHFDMPGTYTICFNAYDNHIDSIYPTLTIDTITKADFDFVHCSNDFVNHSLCAYSFYWDFGDGTNSTSAIPNHKYADTGTYNVTLIAYNGIKSDTVTKSIYINNIGFASTAFTYTISHDTIWVHSEDTSIPLANFYWSFGDGGYATGQDTVHVYKDSTASYPININVVNGCGPEFGATDTIYITQQPPPQPNFSYISTCLGDTTCFINQTIGGITYTWTVSNTSSHHTVIYSSNSNDFCFVFPDTGSYSVSLTTSNITYTESVIKIITIGTIPIADFDFIPCSNNFSNNSSCSASFYWDFGDGASSTETLPHHQYADTGYYQVTLTAYNGNDSSAISKPIHITITSAPTTSFISHISNDTLRVSASYISIPTATYKWNFGDGTHATGKDTIHIYYDTTQYYPVTLTISNACGSAIHTDTIQTIYYNNRPPSGLDFSNSILSIIPNPVSNNSYIDAFFDTYNDNTYLVQVFNDIGQKLFEENFAFQTGINEFKISSDNMSSGLYVMVMQAGNSYIRQKFYIMQTP